MSDWDDGVCRTRGVFTRDEARARRRGVLQGCQGTIRTIADYPFDHISFAHKRLLLAALNMTERDPSPNRARSVAFCELLKLNKGEGAARTVGKSSLGGQFLTQER
jgi:hypothetical protein